MNEFSTNKQKKHIFFFLFERFVKICKRRRAFQNFPGRQLCNFFVVCSSLWKKHINLEKETATALVKVFKDIENFVRLQTNF